MAKQKKDDLEKYDIKTMEDSLDIDFSTDDLNLEEAYEFINLTKKPKQTKEYIEQKEADYVINNSSSKFLNFSYVDIINKEHTNLRNMLKKYDVNGELVKNMLETDKDKIFSLAEYLFNEFQKKLNNMDFIFPLTRDEWKFIIDVIHNKLEYDQNEIFQLKEVREKFLDIVDTNIKYLNKQDDEIITTINVNDLIIFYHLFSKYKIKGINKQHVLYISILVKIAERIKLFNAYNIWVQRLSTDLQIWGGSLTIDEQSVKGTVNPPAQIQEN